MAWVYHGVTDPRSNSCDEKVFDETLRPPLSFKLTSKHPERKQIENQMKKTPVKKNVRSQLPEEVLLPDQKRNESEEKEDLPRCKGLKEKHPYADEQKILHPWSQTATTKGDTLIRVRIAHSVLPRRIERECLQKLAQCTDFHSPHQFAKSLAGNGEIAAIRIRNQLQSGEGIPRGGIEPIKEVFVDGKAAEIVRAPG